MKIQSLSAELQSPFVLWNLARVTQFKFSACRRPDKRCCPLELMLRDAGLDLVGGVVFY